MHTLFQLALSQPALLTQHARGYAALLAVEAEDWRNQARLRLVVASCMGLLLACALTLAGVGLMFWPWYQANMPARLDALMLAPGLPFLGALCCAWWLRTHPQAKAFPALRQQIELDLASLQEPPHAAP